MTMSQDEINAMLSGLDGDEAAAPEESETLAQETAPAEEPVPDIPEEVMTKELPPEDAASDGAGEPVAEKPAAAGDRGFDPAEYVLTTEEEDILGEIGNICMGTVATTMFTLLDHRVSITTPVVSIHTTKEVLSSYSTPFVAVSVEYIEGIDGKNLLLLKEYDAALITDLLMGGEGTVEEPVELSEIHMSAISEVMNQMIGASATSMSKILNTPVNISPPVSVHIDSNSDVSGFLDESQIIVKISFDMEIEGLLKSKLLQMIPFELSRKMVENVKGSSGGILESTIAGKNLSENKESILSTGAQGGGTEQVKTTAIPATNPFPPVQPLPQPGNLVDVHPMQFQSFEQPEEQIPTINTSGIGLVQDIPLQVTVELGRTKKNISEILEFGAGTVIVLDKTAGDPVEILANGKLIARGEVVVIEENYGVRITEIIAN